MARVGEAIVMCVDVGPDMQNRFDPDAPTPLEQAIECISWILQRKIFAASKDEFAIVLFGTDDTENPLASDEQGGYSNICVTRELQSPTWDLVKYVQNELTPTNPVGADFLDAIVVSLDLLVSGTAGKKFAGKQVVVFSNLGSPFSDDQLDQVADAIKNSKTELVLFGPHLDLDNDEDYKPDFTRNGPGRMKKTQQQELGERVATKILERVNGQSYTFSQGLSLLSKYISREATSRPWKCDLEIGDELKIPIHMYKKIDKAKLKDSWKHINAQDPSATIVQRQTFHKKDADADIEDSERTDQQASTRPKYPERDEGDDEENGERAYALGKEVDAKDVTGGYAYGSTMVPVDKMDKVAMQYKGTGKCFKVLTFVDLNSVKREYFMGDGCYLAFSDPTDAEGSAAFSALRSAMKQEGVAAIVRYAYNVKSAGYIGALIPFHEGDREIGITECFVFVLLPFAEDCRQYQFPTLSEDKLTPSDEQLKAVDDLITCMDLTNALVDENGRRCEAFKPEDVSNPYFQHTYACMAHRALYEIGPLPRPKKELLASIQPIEERLNLTKSVFDKLRGLFELKVIEQKKQKRTAADIFKTGESSTGGPPAKVSRNELDDAETASIKISSVRPAEDYAAFVDKDPEIYEAASGQLEAIISQFIFDAIGVQFYEKAADCVQAYRRKSIELQKPGVFNSFLRRFKLRLLDNGKQDFFGKLEQEHLGLITDKETGASNVTTQEAVDFFKEDKRVHEVKAATQMDEEPNLLDELE